MSNINQAEYDLFYRLTFMKSLQEITNRIHATNHIQQIMLDLSDPIRDQFKAEQMTLYAVSESKLAIETTFKTDLKAFKDFSLPISGSSIAGYVALTKKIVNIKDAYDEKELDSYNPKLQFRSQVDSRTGFRTRQILAGPILHRTTGEIMGVLQLINSRDENAFSEMFEEGMRFICDTLAIAFEQRLKPPAAIKTKYDHLVADGIISAPELALAATAARRKGTTVDITLEEDFQVSLANIGASLSKYFGVDYKPFESIQTRPASFQKFEREFIEQSKWIVIAEKDGKIEIMCTDPQKLMGTMIVDNFFPQAEIKYFVTTTRDFNQTVELFFSDAEISTPSKDNEKDDDFRLGMVALAEKKLGDRVQKIILDAFHDEAQEIQIKQQYDENRNITLLRNNGTIQRISGEVKISYLVNYPD